MLATWRFSESREWGVGSVVVARFGAKTFPVNVEKVLSLDHMSRLGASNHIDSGLAIANRTYYSTNLASITNSMVLPLRCCIAPTTSTS